MEREEPALTQKPMAGQPVQCDIIPRDATNLFSTARASTGLTLKSPAAHCKGSFYLHNSPKEM